MGVRRLRRRAGAVNLLPVDVTDPPSVRGVVRGMLGAAMVLAGLALGVVSTTVGHIEWRLAALVLALWGAWGFSDSLFGWVLEPLVAADPPPPPHRVVLAGIRLAEIYRTHQHDAAKAEAVIARLVSRYPDAPEL